MPNAIAPSVATTADQLTTELSALLAGTLGLSGGAIPARPDTRVLGAIPELDSVSVVAFLIGVEEQYGIVIHDDEVDAGIFETLGSLAVFVQSKLG